MLADQNDDQIIASLHTYNTLHEAVTCNIFRTAYYIASNDRSFTDYPTLIDLQRLNGVGVGRVLHSNVICADIVSHIANEMKTKLVQQIIVAKPMISILIDESTNLNKESCLIVYIRTTLNDEAELLTFFLSIVALNSTAVDGIVAALLSCLNKEGFSNDLLTECWFGLGTDGASVMLGSKSEVAAQLKALFPKIISWHCFNHRLELSVHDAIKSCVEINHFKTFMNSLYALYSQSPKLQRDLNSVAYKLEVQILKIEEY